MSGRNPAVLTLHNTSRSASKKKRMLRGEPTLLSLKAKKDLQPQRSAAVLIDLPAPGPSSSSQSHLHPLGLSHGHGKTISHGSKAGISFFNHQGSSARVAPHLVIGAKAASTLNKINQPYVSRQLQRNALNPSQSTNTLELSRKTLTNSAINP